MRKVMRLTRCSLILIIGLGATPRAAQAQVCIAIDDAHDTLSPQDRTAALLLVAKQFEQAGQATVQVDCSTRYTLSHVRLGDTIAVTLSGPSGTREGTAHGLDDLPPLYSQMVRSMVSGRPMTGMSVVDRTNVTASQVSTRRVESDRFAYARLGYGGIFGGRTYGTPAVGFGYRTELDSFGVDMSFLNFQVNEPSDYYSDGAASGSVVKLKVLHFTNPTGNTTKYFGGGVGWGWTSFDSGDLDSGSGNGSGLEGELTFGYELARATTLRLFTQVDATFPFYKVSTSTYARSGVTTTRQYAPSAVFSLGIGWQRGRGR